MSRRFRPDLNGGDNGFAKIFLEIKVQYGATKSEELETSGISYTNAEGFNVNAWSWITTENALRDEQGLRRRVRYES